MKNNLLHKETNFFDQMVGSSNYYIISSKFRLRGYFFIMPKISQHYKRKY